MQPNSFLSCRFIRTFNRIVWEISEKFSIVAVVVYSIDFISKRIATNWAQLQQVVSMIPFTHASNCKGWLGGPSPSPGMTLKRHTTCVTFAAAELARILTGIQITGIYLQDAFLASYGKFHTSPHKISLRPEQLRCSGYKTSPKPGTVDGHYPNSMHEERGEERKTSK